MKLVQDFKENNPVYKDVPNAHLAGALYRKYYADKMPIEDFEKIVMGEGYSAGALPMPKYEFNPLQAGIIGAAQGLSFGLADEMAGAVGGGISGLKGKGFKSGYEDVMQQQQEALQAANEQQGAAMLGGEILGAVGTGLAGGAKLAGTKLLQGAGLPTAAGLGALSGGLYDYATGYGGAAERFEGVPQAAALGGLGGLAGGLISRGIGSAFGSAKSLLNRGGANNASAATMADDLIGLGGKSLSQTDDISMLAAQGKQITMPKGAATGDVNLMRLEEGARQGQFGDDIQRQIANIDERTKTDVLNRIQSMVGKTAAESDELLSKGITSSRARYRASKAVQNKLMNVRNDALAKTTVYKDYVRETLSKPLEALQKTPNFKVALMRPDNAPIKDDFKILKDIVNQKSATGVNFNFLQSWRAGLNDYYKQGGQKGALATQMSKVYDNWLDNIAISDAIKAGDEDIAQKIFKANKEYSKFKSLYGTDKRIGQNSAIEKILNQEELTPVQAVNTLFGKSTEGNQYTAQNLRRILKGAAGSAKEEAIKQDFRSGLILRAYEDAQKKGSFNMGSFKNNLVKLKNSEAYKMNLAAPEYDQVMDGLIKDIGKVLDAQSRKDVYSPSAPLIIRYLTGIFDKAGYVLPSSRAAAAGLEGLGKAASARPAKQTIEKALSQVMQEAQGIMSNNTAIYGGIPGGAIANMYLEGDE